MYMYLHYYLTPPLSRGNLGTIRISFPTGAEPHDFNNSYNALRTYRRGKFPLPLITAVF